VYTKHVTVPSLLIALGFYAAIIVCARLRIRYGLLYFVLGLGCWIAVLKSGVDPVIVGLAIGLVAYAAPAARSDLERASGLFRDFREQPTPGLARSARRGLSRALSPNDRLQLIYHPWTSYLIVPLFGLANAGIHLDPSVLKRAYTSPVTLGIIVGYCLGKPVGVTAVSGAVTWGSRGRLRPPVGWGSVVGAGSLAGIGFTVSLLIASIAFQGTALEEAKLGILTAGVVSATLGWIIFAILWRLPDETRTRALLGSSRAVVDLAVPVDDERDHIRGPQKTAVTLVEYGDFECPYCGRAEPVVRNLLEDFGDLRYVWRHLPLHDVHPHAQLAAEAAEAASAQGAFWPMHDLLLEHRDALLRDDLVNYAGQLELDVERFSADLADGLFIERVQVDVESADLSGVAGTPTFFVNGHRQSGPYDIETLSRAVKTAGAHARVEMNPPDAF
jgi:protein-disulfide isomerase